MLAFDVLGDLVLAQFQPDEAKAQLKGRRAAIIPALLGGGKRRESARRARVMAAPLQILDARAGKTPGGRVRCQAPCVLQLVERRVVLAVQPERQRQVDPLIDMVCQVGHGGDGTPPGGDLPGRIAAHGA